MRGVTDASGNTIRVSFLTDEHGKFAVYIEADNRQTIIPLVLTTDQVLQFMSDLTDAVKIGVEPAARSVFRTIQSDRDYLPSVGPARMGAIEASRGVSAELNAIVVNWPRGVAR